MSNAFKTLLEQALEKNNISVSKLATFLNVDRTWLQHALAGRRSLGYDNFEKIIRTLNLTELQNDNLRESFAKEYFEPADYEILKHSLDTINKMYRFEADITDNSSTNDYTVVCKKIIDDYCTTSNQKTFFENLYNIIQAELTNEIPAFYTNYSMHHDSIRLLFLKILSTYDRYISYNHVIFSSNNTTEQDIVDLFLYQNEFAGYGYNTYTIHTENTLDKNISIFPYFLATSNCYILFSEDMQCYIVNSDMNTISYLNNKYNEAFLDAEPFSHFMRTSEDFSLFMSLLSQVSDEINDYAYDLSENLCMASCLDINILKDAIPDCIELKDYFVHGISEFYKALGQIPTNFVFSTNSLLNFVNNDSIIADYHNVTFDILQISPENKLQILNNLSATTTGDIYNYYIINTRKLRMPSYFHAYMFENLTLSFNFKIYDPADYNKYVGVCCNRNPIIYKHLRNLTEYIIHSTYLYSNTKEYAITHIDSAIAYYCSKHNFDK